MEKSIDTAPSNLTRSHLNPLLGSSLFLLNVRKACDLKSLDERLAVGLGARDESVRAVAIGTEGLQWAKQIE